jgi:hypothetical protein
MVSTHRTDLLVLGEPASELVLLVEFFRSSNKSVPAKYFTDVPR